jgi:beta-N-acetylhexosaminidase
MESSTLTRAAIVGLVGPALTDAERALFRDLPPAGVILFARNIVAPAQLAALMASLDAVLPAGAVRMVDQEGGRVARLRPPHWRAHPPAAWLGALPAAAGERAAWITGALIGQDCAGAGFGVVNAPVLDVRHDGAHDVIGDRAFSRDPARVAVLGRAFAAGLLASGMQPVAKHIPGHGRAGADSHLELPRLAGTRADDLLPFIENADIGWAMTAHILYEADDAVLPATLSAAVIGGTIRGACGFDGVLVSDDLAMRALSGGLGDLAAAAIGAGCDLTLHCSGETDESAAVLGAVPRVTEAAGARLRRAAARVVGAARRLDADALAAEREALLRETADHG